MCPLVQAAQGEGGPDCVPSPHEPRWSCNFSHAPGVSMECQSTLQIELIIYCKRDTRTAKRPKRYKMVHKDESLLVRGDHDESFPSFQKQTAHQEHAPVPSWEMLPRLLLFQSITNSVPTAPRQFIRDRLSHDCVVLSFVGGLSYHQGFLFGRTFRSVHVVSYCN